MDFTLEPLNLSLQSKFASFPSAVSPPFPSLFLSAAPSFSFPAFSSPISLSFNSPDVEEDGAKSSVSTSHVSSSSILFIVLFFPLLEGVCVVVDWGISVLSKGFVV